MTVNGHPGVLALAALASLLLLDPARVGAQQPAQPTEGSAADAPVGEISTEQVDRVRRALDYKPMVDLNGDQLRFYIQIIGRPPMTFADYVKGSDLRHGPTRRGNPMTHQEFLKMVTPKEMYSSGGITPAELLQFALTNWVGQTLVRRGLEEINAAQTEQEKQDIRDRIDRELAILKSNAGN